MIRLNVTDFIDAEGMLAVCKRRLHLTAKAADHAAWRATRKATEYAADLIREATPVGQGEGRAGVRSHEGEPHLYEGWVTKISAIGPGYSGEVINRMPYAAAVEKGAGPREIKAKNVKYLWWPGIVNGRMRFVNWPGFGGRHMARDAFNEAKDQIYRIYREEILRTIKEVFYA